MSAPIRLKPISTAIDAPRELVFQMLSSFGRGRVSGDAAESSRVVSDDGNVKTVEFRTRAGPFVYTTLERVELHPPHRIAFEHLRGPLRFAEEEFILRETAGGDTELTHRGSFIWRRFPLLGRLGGLVYTRPMYHRVTKRHLAAVKRAAEARAARSHVFARDARRRADAGGSAPN